MYCQLIRCSVAALLTQIEITNIEPETIKPLSFLAFLFPTSTHDVPWCNFTVIIGLSIKIAPTKSLCNQFIN